MREIKIANEKIKKLDYLINSINKRDDELNVPSHCFFLGAGCSFESGVPLSSGIIKLLQKYSFINLAPGGHEVANSSLSDKESVEIFINSNKKDFDSYVEGKEKMFSEKIEKCWDNELLKLPSNLLEEHKNPDEKERLIKNDFVELVKKDFLYGDWFEEYSEDPRERQKFIENLIEKVEPDNNYRTFANLVNANLIKNIFTTNFDDLLNESLIRENKIKPRVYSHNETAKYISLTSKKPNIIKLHGDYLFENIRNTNDETGFLEKNMSLKLKEALNKLGLIVVGYGGADISVMHALEEIKKDRQFHLIWCNSDLDKLNWRVVNLINSTKNSYFVQIQDFATLLEKISKLISKESQLPKEDLQKNIPIYYSKEKNEEHFEHNVSISLTLPQVKTEVSHELATAPKDYKVYFEKASASKDPDEKIELYSNSIKLNNEFFAAYINRGIAYLTKNNFDSALKDFNKANELQSKNPIVYENMGLFFLLQNKINEALNCFNESISLYANTSSLDANSYFSYYNRGICYSKLEKYEKSKKDFLKALEVSPENALIRNELGNLYAVLKEYDNSIKEFQESIRLDPNFSNPHNGLGNIYSERNENENALEEYKKAIKINPYDAIPCFNIGNIYETLNNYPLAFKYYEKAIELNSENADFFRGRGNLYFYLKNYEKAIEDYNKSISLNPHSAHSYNNRGMAYFSMGKDENALRDYNKAIELDQNYSDAYNSKANLYRIQKHLDLAFENIKRAIEINPENGMYYATLAEIYSEKNNDDEFYKNIKKSLELGCAVWELIENEAYNKYRNEQRFVELIKKYKPE